MASWDDIGSTYVGAITNAMPLHRLVLFGIGFIAVLAVTNQTHPSIVETIFNLKIGDLVNPKSALLEATTVLYILIGLAAPLFGWVMAAALARITFALASRGGGLDARVADALKRCREIISLDLKERRDEIEILEKALEKPQLNMKRLNSFCESLCGTAAVFLVGSIWGGLLDLSVGVVSLVGGEFVAILAIRFFFREYYGPALFVAQLQGRRPPSLS